jgi:phage-related protein
MKVQWRWPLGKPLVDGFSGGLYEVRTTCAKVEYRVFFAVGDGVMVLLHGYQKGSKTTPAHEIDLARKRLKEVNS